VTVVYDTDEMHVFDMFSTSADVQEPRESVTQINSNVFLCAVVDKILLIGSLVQALLFESRFGSLEFMKSIISVQNLCQTIR
jgi:hypothetical protein